MSEPNGRSADDWFHDYCEATQRAKKAEDEVVQLKAERKYLANVLSSYGDEDEEMSAEDWERSARRAVAAGEE